MYRGFKYSNNTRTFYSLSTLRRRYAKKFEELGGDDSKFEKWLFTEKGFRLYNF